MIRFVILGPPVTKKNHGQIIHSGPKCMVCKRGTGRPFMLPSSVFKAWEKDAAGQIARQLDGALALPIRTPVTLRCQVYRDRAGVADLLNYEAAVSDMLETAGILEDDRLVASTDGSRLRIDRENPRVEIEIEPFTEEIDTAPLKTKRKREKPATLPGLGDDDGVPIT